MDTKGEKRGALSGAGRALLLVIGLVGAMALAGSRAKESTGAVPALSTYLLSDGGTATDGGTTDGLSLSEVEGCRASARVTDGGTVNSGTLVAYYFDPVLGWVRANSALDCALESNKLIDGGAPSVQVCPDIGILAKYGRIAMAASGLKGADAGAITANVRLECWGRTLP